MFYNKKIELENSDSIIKFETTGGGNWEKWDRYISIKDNKAYHIGNICDTCSFFFERLDGAHNEISASLVSEKLRSGVSFLDEDLLLKTNKIIPNGKYEVLLQTISPVFIELSSDEDYFANEQVGLWGLDSFYNLPHHPKTNYYRTKTVEINKTTLLFEFVIPLVPINWLEEKQIEFYKGLLKTKKDKALPTALSISILDNKGPADWDDDTKYSNHLCLAHYVLDGHHKLFASSENKQSINLLSYLSIDNSIVNNDEIEVLLSKLNIG